MRVRFRSTMCVPPCDCGVKPMPARPVSRPECIRIKPDERGGEQNLDDGEDGQHAAGSVAELLSAPPASRIACTRSLGDLILRHVRRPRRPPGRARCRCVAAEPVRTITRACRAARSRICAVASMPSITGIAMSISDDVRPMLARELDRAAAVARPRHDVDSRVGREDRLERLGEQALVVRDQHPHLASDPISQYAYSRWTQDEAARARSTTCS